MRLVPRHDQVIVKVIEPEAKTGGGIDLPDTVQQQPDEGIVRAVGPGKLLSNGGRVPIDLKEGDRVTFGRYSGSQIVHDGEHLLIIPEKDILTLVKPAPATAPDEYR